MSDEPVMDIANIDTTALLPSSISSDPDIQALCAALDARWQEIAPVIPLFGVLATIDQQPDAVLDKLAYQFHVDYYDTTWDLAKKRSAVINSIRLHRVAGTRGAVEDVIDSIWSGGALLSEWWEHGGEPGTFRVVLTNGQTQDNLTLFLASIQKMKRATDHLEIVSTTDAESASINFGAAQHWYRSYRLQAQ
jgi:phage tail P2-like protein